MMRCCCGHSREVHLAEHGLCIIECNCTRFVPTPERPSRMRRMLTTLRTVVLG